MTTFTEENRIGDVLKREWDQLFNRETGVVTGGDFVAGQVLGTVTASGKVTDYDGGAADGSETASGVLLFKAEAAGADVSAAYLARGPAVVARGALVGLDADGEADLAALNIIVRDDV